MKWLNFMIICDTKQWIFNMYTNIMSIIDKLEIKWFISYKKSNIYTIWENWIIEQYRFNVDIRKPRWQIIYKNERWQIMQEINKIYIPVYKIIK